MMYNYIDTDSPTTTVLFFLFLVIAGAMTALNLVLAEIMNSFNTQQDEERSQIDDQNKENKKVKVKSPITKENAYKDPRFLIFSLKSSGHGEISDGSRSWD